jgi:hypothetical protein
VIRGLDFESAGRNGHGAMLRSDTFEP